MPDFDRAAFLASLPTISLPAGFALSPWRTASFDDRAVEATVTLLTPTAKTLKRTVFVQGGGIATPPELAARDLYEQVYAAVAELRAEALIVA